jgi:hypothetical protein
MDAGTALVSLATALGSTAATFGQQIAARRKTGNQTNQHQTDLGKSAHESLPWKHGIIDCTKPGTGLFEKAESRTRSLIESLLRRSRKSIFDGAPKMVRHLNLRRAANSAWRSDRFWTAE